MPAIRSPRHAGGHTRILLRGPAVQSVPQLLDEDVVQIAALAIHRDANAGPAQPVCLGKGCKLRSLIGIHDVGRSEPIDGLVQRLDAEVRVERVRYLPRENHPGVPIHDCHQVEKAAAHRQISDIHAPNLVWPVHPQSAQEVGVGLAPLRWLAGVRPLKDRHEAHQSHEPTNTLLVHHMALVSQVPRYLANTEEWRVEELHIDQPQ